MFAQILQVFQGFFSRGYWFGAFLPVSLCAASHAFIASQVYQGFAAWGWFTANGSDAAKLPVVVAGIMAVAYASAPMLPWVRGLLDGSLLPGWLHDALRREHLASTRRKRDEIAAAYLAYGQFQLLSQKTINGLRDARSAGESLSGSNVPGNVDVARRCVDSMQRAFRSGSPASLKSAQIACEAVERALRSNSAEKNLDLDRCHRALVKLLQDAEIDARHRADALAERVGFAVELREPQATRMADARRFTEQYCEEAYRVQFDYLWPRLQLLLPDQGAVVDRIVATRAQGDFALLSMVATLSIAVVWLPLMGWHGAHPLIPCALGLGVPLAMAFFYQLALENEIAFGELLKALVDRYRFDVLKVMLRQPLPPTLDAERELWADLARSQTRGLTSNVSYRHPAS